MRRTARVVLSPVANQIPEKVVPIFPAQFHTCMYRPTIVINTEGVDTVVVLYTGTIVRMLPHSISIVTYHYIAEKRKAVFPSHR